MMALSDDNGLFEARPDRRVGLDLNATDSSQPALVSLK